MLHSFIHMAFAASVMLLGLLHMRPLQHWLHSRVPRWAWYRGTLRVTITPMCRRSFIPWTDLAFLLAGVPLEHVSRHVVVTMDASSTGWGATCNGQAASGLWTGPWLIWHINCLELLAVAVHLLVNPCLPLTDPFCQSLLAVLPPYSQVGPASETHSISNHRWLPGTRFRLLRVDTPVASLYPRAWGVAEHAKSTSQFSLAFSLNQRGFGLSSKTPMSSRHNVSVPSIRERGLRT